MLKHALLIGLHLVLLLLAMTAFTIITAPLGFVPFKWSLFAYAYSNGWGYVYHSDYSLAQVLMYILAYGSGLVLYPRLTHPRGLGLLAAVTCLAGTISFAVEISHWLFDHNLCLIVSAPIVVLPIAVWTIISLSLRKTKTVNLPTAAP